MAGTTTQPQRLSQQELAARAIHTRLAVAAQQELVGPCLRQEQREPLALAIAAAAVAAAVAQRLRPALTVNPAATVAWAAAAVVAGVWGKTPALAARGAKAALATLWL